MYLETLNGFCTFAEQNPAQFPTLWEAICMAHAKAHNLAMQAKWIESLNIEPPAYIAPILTADERAAEEKLNSCLGDNGRASDRQFHRVLTWLETVDIGDAILVKVKQPKAEA
jgi:hypothetical protein